MKEEQRLKLRQFEYYTDSIAMRAGYAGIPYHPDTSSAVADELWVLLAKLVRIVRYSSVAQMCFTVFRDRLLENIPSYPAQRLAAGLLALTAQGVRGTAFVQAASEIRKAETAACDWELQEMERFTLINQMLYSSGLIGTSNPHPLL